jgi:DNA polymerase-3 subunit delta
MAATKAREANPVILVFGDDDFKVGQRAREIHQRWCAELGGMDHETIDANVNNGGEALKALGRLREALQTLPFFGGGKAIWFKNCNFLAEERSATTDVISTLAELADELKAFTWTNVRLLISALAVDKRRVFYKTLEKIGEVEFHAGWSADKGDWTDQAELAARKRFRELGKQISEEALAELVSRIGPHPRQLETEIEKLSLYAGDRPTVEFEDVDAVACRNKTARAFALGDALGDRDLPRLLRRLDEDLWEAKLDPNKSEIGLLYGLISKVRSLILLKEMLREGWVKPGTGNNYAAFKAQLEGVPRDQLPEDRKYNPLAINAYVLFKALPQARNYTEEELVRAMELLLQCNQRLVSSSLNEQLVLQQTLVEIVGAPAKRLPVVPTRT